jgi:queuosine precursor transporter
MDAPGGLGGDSVLTQERSRMAQTTDRRYRYYDIVMAGFVTVLLCSNLIGPAKTSAIDLGLPIFPSIRPGDALLTGVLAFGAGNIFFPFSYVFGDILTEVYGYAKARRVIWVGLGAMVFAAIMSQVILRLPVDPNEPYNEQYQPAIEMVFGNTWRIVLASNLSFLVGDFVNSFVLAKMKVLQGGRHLWMRTIGSTIAGQGVDSVLFYPIAFYGIWATDTLFAVALFNWGFKVLVEAVMTPFTYWACGALKRRENEDWFDDNTNFTPFSLKD